RRPWPSPRKWFRAPVSARRRRRPRRTRRPCPSRPCRRRAPRRPLRAAASRPPRCPRPLPFPARPAPCGGVHVVLPSSVSLGLDASVPRTSVHDLPLCPNDSGGSPTQVLPPPQSDQVVSARGAALDVVGVDRLGAPGEHLAQVLAHGLDLVLRLVRAQLLELGRTRVLVVDEALGEGAALNVREDLLHGLLRLGAHD